MQRGTRNSKHDTHDLHIDMDAFYASVEKLDDPRLKNKCVIVGGTSSRGVVSAASYEARRYGVHSAMPIFKAKQKCPHGVFVPPRMGRYKEVSKKVMALLKEFSPLVEPVSIDEAYMDITGCRRLFGEPQEIAREIKEKIRDRVQLTCSVGVAPNKFLAKIASDLEKPDGLTVILPDQVSQFVESLAIQKVPGVGKKWSASWNCWAFEPWGMFNGYRNKPWCSIWANLASACARFLRAATIHR